MQEIEMCIYCDEPTNRAGEHEDSLYLDDGSGPFCEGCFSGERIHELESEVERLRELVRPVIAELRREDIRSDLLELFLTDECGELVIVTMLNEAVALTTPRGEEE